MSNPFGGIGAICVSKKPRTLHADVPTFPLLMLIIISSCWTCFSISPRAFSCPSPRTDPETSSGWHLCTHRSSLIAQDPKTCFYVLMSNPKTHGSLLITHYSKRSSVKNQNLRLSVASVPSACHWKSFTKPHFRINPAGKSKVPSWKIFISQLENYFFSIGKSKFRSRAK